MLYVRIPLIGATTKLPEVAVIPAQPPDVVHAVAFVDDHVRVDD